LQEHFALEMFPQARTTGEALSRFYDTPRGRECLNASCAVKARDLGVMGVDDYAMHAKSFGDSSHPLGSGAAENERMGLNADGSVPGFEDNDDFQEACASMKRARPDLKTREAVELAVHSVRHRAEVAAKLESKRSWS
jgi:hypothetical protein